MRLQAMALSAIVIVLNFSAALPQTKHNSSASTKQTCARASYPGDPICDVNADDDTSLPIPSSRVTKRSDSAGYRVNDNVSVEGKNNFNDNRYGGVQLNNPNPNPRSQDVNGGGAVNYKF